MERKRPKEYSLAFRLAQGENEARIKSYFEKLSIVDISAGRWSAKQLREGNCVLECEFMSSQSS